MSNAVATARAALAASSDLLATARADHGDARDTADAARAEEAIWRASDRAPHFVYGKLTAGFDPSTPEALIASLFADFKAGDNPMDVAIATAFSAARTMRPELMGGLAAAIADVGAGVELHMAATEYAESIESAAADATAVAAQAVERDASELRKAEAAAASDGRSNLAG